MKLKIIFKNIYFIFRKSILSLMPIKIKGKDIKAIEIKSILVIRIDRIGDLIVSLPALKALRQAFPKARISLLVCRDTYLLLDGLSWIDEIILYEGFIDTVRRLRQIQRDLSIDLLMDYPIKTALLAHFSGARFSAGFDIEARGCLFDLKFRPSPDKKPLSQHILDLVRMIAKSYSGSDITVQMTEPEILISRENKDYIKALLKEKGILEGDLLIGIHPGGHYLSQCWMPESFAQLADKIIDRYRAKVIIVGSRQEESLVEKVINLMKGRAVKVIGLSLDKLASLISLMDLFIGNNSGPLHIACAVKTPTVSTMGPTDPDFWWPQGREHIVIRHNLACSPCNRGFCREHDCMKSITVEEMEKAVDIQMERRGKKDKNG